MVEWQGKPKEQQHRNCSGTSPRPIIAWGQQRIAQERLPLKLLQVRDDLVFRARADAAPEAAALICAGMEQAMAVRVPLRAEAGVGADWMAAK